MVLLGIPYPAFKDAKVIEKKKFNDHATNRRLGLITGEQWYSLQAFRAMNQVQVLSSSMDTWSLALYQCSVQHQLRRMRTYSDHILLSCWCDLVYVVPALVPATFHLHPAADKLVVVELQIPPSGQSHNGSFSIPSS